MTDKMTVVCMSHKEDVDGLCSAALVKAAFGADSVILSDYPSLIPRLEKLANAEKRADKLFICDLGLSKKNEARFVELLSKMSDAGTAVTYIDHHDISAETAKALKKAGVALVHTIDECTSVQVYNKYKKKLPAHAVFFAAMGALTDYMEARPIASGLVSRYDRQFLMLEATAMSYMISASQKDEDFLEKMVDTLARMKYPHDVKGGFELAEKYAKKVAAAVETIQEGIVKLDNLAHAPSTVDLSSSMVVNFVLGSTGKPAAMVYKLKEDIGSYVVSIRGSKECKAHLGRLVNEVATDLGGSGGGHDRACGAVVPKDKLEKFIATLDKRIS
ncbi:DHHA1 domain-containing protein [Nitrososphaera sp.]|uniref:DHHA1 domain-containing protein n=1 Tax=Nitrososphaera sp. TaxID=1971748 RepID=UPI00307E4A5E